MPDWVGTGITATTAFVATNLDDILILMMFFAQGRARFHPAEIVIGQYLGFSLLIGASLPGFLGGYLIPRPWLGWLGLVPIGLGLFSLWKTSQSTDTDAPEIQDIQSISGSPCWLRPQIYQVAAVTIANGGDNISLYSSTKLR